MKSIVTIAALVAVSGSAFGQDLRQDHMAAPMTAVPVKAFAPDASAPSTLSVDGSAFTMELSYQSSLLLAAYSTYFNDGGTPTFAFDGSDGVLQPISVSPPTAFQILVTDNLIGNDPVAAGRSYYTNPNNTSWTDFATPPGADTVSADVVNTNNGTVNTPLAFTAQELVASSNDVRMAIAFFPDATILPGAVTGGVTEASSRLDWWNTLLRGDDGIGTFYTFGPTDRGNASVFQPDFEGLFPGDGVARNALTDAIQFNLNGLLPAGGGAWDTAAPLVCEDFVFLGRISTDTPGAGAPTGGGLTVVSTNIDGGAGAVPAGQFITDNGNIVFDVDGSIDFGLALTEPDGMGGDNLLNSGDSFDYAGYMIVIRATLADTGTPCPGDIADDNGTPGADGQVSFGDFLASLGLLGPCGPATSNPDCTGDNADDNGTPGGDGQVSFGDFLFLLGVLGPCP